MAQRTVVVTCGEGFEWVESLQRCDVACPPGVSRDAYGRCVYIAPYPVNQAFRRPGTEEVFALPIAPIPPAPRVVRWIEPRNMPTPRPMPMQRLWPGTPMPYVLLSGALGQAVTDPLSIGQAKAALFAWSKSPGVSPPLSNYGTSLEDLNPNWTSRDGIMLHGFSVWWNSSHPNQQLPLGTGAIASAELTAAHMVALQQFGTSQIPAGWVPPPIPTTLPTPAQGQAQATCALTCEQKYGVTSGQLNQSALLTCLSACAQGQPVTPPAQPTLPTPPTQPTLPPAKTETKSSGNGLLIAGGIAAALLVGTVVLTRNKSLALNPRGIYRGTGTEKDDFVVHRHNTSGRFFVDLVFAGGTHSKIGSAKGYYTIDEAVVAAQEEAHRRGIQGTIFKERNGQLQKIGYIGPSANPRGTVADNDSARELELFIDNDARFSPDNDRGIGRAVRDNLKKKWVKGTYNHAFAPKGWQHMVDSAAKAYEREIGSDTFRFNAATRRQVAKVFADSGRQMFERGEW